MFKKIWNSILAHKIRTILLIIILVAAGYYAYKKFIANSEDITSYVLAEVTKGTLINSVSGTGQVSASNQVSLTSKASGQLTYLKAKVGDKVKAGTLIAQIDAGDAYSNLRDAQSSLEVAKLSLAKVKEPTDELTLLQAENSLAQAKESQTDAEDNLLKYYDDGFNDVASAFLDLPTVMTGLQDILYGTSYGTSQSNIDYYVNSVKNYNDAVYLYRDDAISDYAKARDAYDKNFIDYKNTTLKSNQETIKKIILETYETAKLLGQAVKSTNNLIQFYKDELTKQNLTVPTLAATHLSNLNSYTSKTTSHVANLLAAKTSLESADQTIVNCQRTVVEKEKILANLKKGTDELDLASSQLSVQQKENAVLDAKQALADYTIRAPIDGVIAEVSVSKGDTVSNGAAIVTIISEKSIAEISLNEVDIAKIKIDQKATLTFDAVDDLTITGKVAEVDAVGTSSNGVVTYGIKIAFDSEDDRIKPSMSTTANIIIESKTDVLLVPSAAIKSNGDISYVELVAAENVSDLTTAENVGLTLTTAPTRQEVSVGSTDDTNTEVVSGLKDGDLIVVRTVSSSLNKNTSSNNTATTKTTNTAGSLRAMEGIGGGAGGPPAGMGGF